MNTEAKKQRREAAAEVQMRCDRLRLAVEALRQAAEVVDALLSDQWWEDNAYDWMLSVTGMPGLALYVATMKTSVALATADLLEDEADRCSLSRGAVDIGLVPPTPSDQAMALADAILGGEQ